MNVSASYRNRCRRLICALLAGACVIGTISPAAAQGPLRTVSEISPPDGTEALQQNNWIRLGMTQPFLLNGGDHAQFMQRHRIPQTTFAGIEDLYLEQFVGSTGLLTVRGRAVFDNRDYLLRAVLEDPELGFARAGFRNFRTWYDGTAGFLPGADAFFAPPSADLAMDRGEAWFEGGLTLPDLPRATLKYTRQFRKGQKPSLVWGDANIDGAGMRNISPGYWASDEVRNIFESSVRHTLGPTGITLGLRYEQGDISNARNMWRRPEETQERHLTHREADRRDMFHAHAVTNTRVRSNIRLTTSYAFTTLKTDLSGSRIYGSDYDPVYDPVFRGRQFRDVGFIDMAGTARVRHHAANVNVMASPWTHFTVVPSFRLEKRDVDSDLTFRQTYVQGPPTLSTEETPFAAFGERSLIDAAGSLEARYTGLPNLVLYARGDWLEGTGDLMNREIALASGNVSLERETDDRRATRKYLAGANWHPIRGLNLGVQMYRRYRSVNFTHLESPRGATRYPAFITAQDVTTDDVNFRVRWRLFRGLSVMSRYDFQKSAIDAASAELDEVRSADITTHVFSQSITWVPQGRFFVQGTLNYVIDRNKTPVNDYQEAALNVVLEDRNDYIHSSLISRFVLTNRVDLEGQYFFYHADNYVNNADVSLPFGSGAREHGVSAGAAWQLNGGLRWTARYVYFINRDATSGRLNDYDLQMLQTGLEYRF